MKEKIIQLLIHPDPEMKQLGLKMLPHLPSTIKDLDRVLVYLYSDKSYYLGEAMRIFFKKTDYKRLNALCSMISSNPGTMGMQCLRSMEQKLKKVKKFEKILTSYDSPVVELEEKFGNLYSWKLPLPK